MKIAIDPIFKSGDKVYHYKYGWGEILRIDYSPVRRIIMDFENEVDFSREMYNESNLLSFTEYRLEGFSQERPEELPKKGQIVWGKTEFFKEWYIGHFYEKRGDDYLISSNPNPTGWHNIVQEITTKNPYNNENASI